MSRSTFDDRAIAAIKADKEFFELPPFHASPQPGCGETPFAEHAWTI